MTDLTKQWKISEHSGLARYSCIGCGSEKVRLLRFSDGIWVACSECDTEFSISDVINAAPAISGRKT